MELNQVMRQLLQELTRFQERARTKNPDKVRPNPAGLFSMCTTHALLSLSHTHTHPPPGALE